MRSIALALLTAVTLSSALSAQTLPEPWADPEDRPPRVDISGSAGVLMPTNWSRLVLLGSLSSATGVLEQVLSREIRVESEKAYGGSVTYWEGRYGFRVQGDYSKSSLKISNAPLVNTPSAAPAAGGSTLVPVKTFLYDARAVIGFVEYEPGRKVWPYGFVGVGGITYDLGRIVTPPLNVVTIAPARSDGRETVVVVGDRQFVLTENELGANTVFAFTFGVGTDFRVPLGAGGVGVRLELADHLAHSPLDLTIQELTPYGAAVSDDPVRFGLVHHLTASAGLVLHFGR